MFMFMITIIGKYLYYYTIIILLLLKTLLLLNTNNFSLKKHVIYFSCSSYNPHIP